MFKLIFMAKCFHSSLHRFYLFLLFVNLVGVLCYCFIEHYQSWFFVLTLGMFNLGMLRAFFKKTQLRKICFLEEEFKVELMKSFFIPFSTKEEYCFTEINYSYKYRQTGRLSKSKILKFLTKEGHFIGIVTPELFFWKENDIKMLKEKLDDLKVSRREK